MTNETLNCIKNRRSIRAYQPGQIQGDALNAVLEAGLYAPSAMNQQSWHFTVLQNGEIISRLNTAVIEFYRNSPVEHFKKLVGRPDFHIFHHAPTAIIVSGEAKASLPHADCAAATENVLVAAASVGLASCWVNSVVHFLDSEPGARWKKELGIPDGYIPFHGIALGYGAAENAPAPPRKANTVNYVQ